MRWTGHVGELKETRNAYRNLVKRVLRRKWTDIINIDLGELDFMNGGVVSYGWLWC